jgi:ankyrin repeat protein
MAHEEMLLNAVKSRHYNGVKRAFDRKANVNAPDDMGWTSLHHAAYHGYDEIVDLLLAHDDIDTSLTTRKQETSRDLAFLNCHAKIVQKLEAAWPPFAHVSRVAEPKTCHAEPLITTKGRHRSLFD